MGFLTDYKFTKRVEEVPFPSPLEVIGVSNPRYSQNPNDTKGFPSPLEVIGVSNKKSVSFMKHICQVSVPSRGDWGF